MAVVGCFAAVAVLIILSERQPEYRAVSFVIFVMFLYFVVGLASHVVRLVVSESFRRGYLRPFGVDDVSLCLKERPAAQRITAVLAVALILWTVDVDPEDVAMLMVAELLFELCWWFIRLRIARLAKKHDDSAVD